MVVLDTNVIIDFLEGKESVVSEIKKYPPSEMSMTLVNAYELLKYRKRERLEEALENLATYNLSNASIKASADAYKRLKSKGAMMSDSDLLIFGICAANNEVLLTQDKAFEHLRDANVVVIG